MSKFYGSKEEDKYPDIGQNNSNPYANAPAQSSFNGKSEGQNLRNSVFLKDSESTDDSCCGKCCKCFNLDNYKDNFKVDNDIVKNRIMLNLKFWSGGFFEDLKADYDYYGPFWLYTTMVFLCGAVHNLLRYEANSVGFAYSFGVIGVSMGIFYILGMAVSALYGVLFGCLGLNTKMAHIICLYGYAMSNYCICVLLCMFNMPLLTWLFLIYGAGTKVAFILKNIFQKLQVPTAKKIMVLIMVFAEAFIQLIAIKFALIVNISSTTGQPVHFMGVNVSHFAFDPLSFRTHLSQG